ncbi:hypothetical protein MJO28_002958 [Puccinia striiformis f. sp. tritici]|uniref:Uncharacterized protein n=1 Tax=Puccinia striiformis f. sp. tritici TaxID=168172 RepID=A0ACC0ETK9_9BASI|nr:hypothetical protein Pst134EB_006164 [Puccinia striiformis f. sp. tritici]KAI7959167.1 hypothetical protein MJO28_002958 [Puccinia striiformis f. sp. tritici]KAI7964924.1 hypothetical protein MJO29_003022 [Puccinia striiformis f. sp. tritici]KAI9629492.1 hypothetical protein KEM48_012961 [Puccinia striiformis f. sp. tritici PST-130]
MDSLVEILLRLLSHELISNILSIPNQQKQLSSLLNFFTKKNQSVIIPSIAPHLVKKLIKLYIQDISLPKEDYYYYGPNELPLPLYLSICSVYDQIDTFGFTKTGEYCYHRLSLDDPTEIQLIQNHLQSSRFMTIVNLTGHRKFTDSGLVNLHLLLGISIRSIILDHTSVTDHGIAHLSRALSIDDHQQAPSSSSSDLHPSDAFRELKSISLRGLNLVTDRSAKKLTRFPSLLSIDLTGTSCTDASRTIMNKSHPSSPFRYARSDEDLAMFSNSLDPSQKIIKLLNLDKPRTNHIPFFFQINTPDNHRRLNDPNNIQTNQEPYGFSTKFKPIQLLRNDPLSSSIPTNPPPHLYDPPSNGHHHQQLPGTSTPQHTSIKRKRLDTCIFNDLDEVRKIHKRN